MCVWMHYIFLRLEYKVIYVAEIFNPFSTDAQLMEKPA